MNKKTLYNEYPAYLKTDILPFEIPIIFSNDNFYDYILKNRKKYKKIFDEIKFNECPASSLPLSFNSYVRENKERKISIINPFSYMYILKFIKNYENIYLNEFNNSNYSIRYPKSKVNNYQYKNKFIRTNTYFERVDKVEKKNGTYYKISPYRRSYEFENSSFFQKQVLKYEHFNKMDIKGCFNSIYTHSYKWIEAKKFYDSKELSNTLNMYSVIDKLMQSINNHKTNGILVGPEFMRLIAEILLTGIDNEIKEEIIKKEKLNVKIYRFIDDFYIFSKREDDIKTVRKIIKKKYNEYHLIFNDRKFVEKNEIFILNEWHTEVTYMMESLDWKKFYSPTNKKIIMDILIKFKDERSTVVTYIISIIFNKINDEIKEIRKVNGYTVESLKESNNIYSIYENLYKENIKNKVKVERQEVYDNFQKLKKIQLKKVIISEKRIFKIFEELIFYLKISPKYINTLKILSLSIELLILEEELVCEKSLDYKTLLKNVFNRELKILRDFPDNFDDVSNLLLLFEYLEIYLDEEEIKKEIKKDKKNLLKMAYIYRYCKNTNDKEYKEIIKDIEKKVKLKEKINGLKIAENEDIWKLLLFHEINKKKYDKLENPGKGDFKKHNINYILEFLDQGGFFIDYTPLKRIGDLKILNTKIYYKSLVTINY